MAKRGEMKCKNRVVYQYAWAGQIKKCCEKHLRQIQTVAQVIGMPIVFQKIKSKEFCPNIDEESNET